MLPDPADFHACSRCRGIEHDSDLNAEGLCSDCRGWSSCDGCGADRYSEDLAPAVDGGWHCESCVRSIAAVAS
jgi:hypothetical protein